MMNEIANVFDFNVVSPIGHNSPITAGPESKPEALLDVGVVGRCACNQGDVLRFGSHVKGSIHYSGDGVSQDGAGHKAASRRAFQVLCVAPANYSSDDRYPWEKCRSLCQQEVQGMRIDGDDDVDLHPGVLAAQEISHSASIGRVAKSGHVQVLGVKLYIEEWVRTEALPDPLLGHLVGRVGLILTVKDQNPFCLFWLRSIQWLENQKQQKGRTNKPIDRLHNGFLIFE